MRNVIIFGQYLGTLSGGAEKSMFGIIKTLQRSAISITIVRGSRNSFLADGEFNRWLELNQSVQIIDIETPEFGIFPFVKYYQMKRLNIGIDLGDYDEIYVFDFFGRAVVSNLIGAKKVPKITHHLRSEADIGIYKNYNHGVKYFLWPFYYLFQYYFLRIYINDVKKISMVAMNFCNSNFIKSLVYSKLKVNVNVVYPKVDICNVKLLPENIRNKVLFIGDNNLKGLEVVRSLAKLNPDMSFKLVVRSSNLRQFKFKLANEEFTEWSDDLNNLYADCQVLVVPSQCNEAYGRVAREGYLLGLKILCSNLGGLPEAVDYNPEYLISDYSNVMAWNAALRRQFAK